MIQFCLSSVSLEILSNCFFFHQPKIQKYKNTVSIVYCFGTKYEVHGVSRYDEYIICTLQF